ncbi:MAG: DUF342 domain-containing protein [Bdellovibrionales bacterium]|nr:DUF342 domain-containing protein [Bdellovibrionales bacterium]
MAADTVIEEQRDGISIRAYLSEDKLKLYLDVKREPGAAASLVALTDVLSSRIPKELLAFGVLRDVVKSLEKDTEVLKRRIASGSAPQPGRDGKLLLLVKKLHFQPEMKADSKGKVDMTSLHLFENIREGQIIGRLYPPGEGTPGRTALGEEIPAAEGAVHGVVLDESIHREPPDREDVRYEILRATRNGLLEERNGTLQINEELSISGDLDHRFGSIDFIGGVRVAGDVQPGFSIRAEKNITVHGNVYQSSLSSKSGDIRVDGIVFGEENDRIVGGGDFFARSVSEAYIEVLGNVWITEEARNSTVRSGKAICARTAQAFGGKILCAVGMEIGYLGNDTELSSEVILSSDVETTSEYALIEVALQNHLKALSLIESHLGPYSTNSDRIQLLKSPLREKMEQLLSKRVSVANGVAALEEKKRQLLKGMSDIESRVLSVVETLYPGVQIHAAEHQFSAGEPLQGPFSLLWKLQENTFEKSEYVPIQEGIERERRENEEES